jgi:UDP-N-acetylmuramoyl-tripeptide--D-alanyl-D-alanine ligase
VTNVRPVHLENFRSISGIAEAKRELVESLPADGMAVLNNDDVRVRRFGKSFAGRVITFGVEAASTYKVAERRSLGLEGSEFRLDYKSRGHLLKVPLIGDHNICNCLPGIAVAHQLGLRFEIISQSLEKLKPVAGRGVVSHFREGFSMVDDSYNSNPAALEAMIVFLARAQGYQRKILVAGEMLELGEKSEQFHRDCGKLAASENITVAVGIQGNARFLCAAAKSYKRCAVETIFFDNSIEAGEWLSQQVKSGDLIVVKGSRGVRTERVVEAIEKNHLTL